MTLTRTSNFGETSKYLGIVISSTEVTDVQWKSTPCLHHYFLDRPVPTFFFFLFNLLSLIKGSTVGTDCVQINYFNGRWGHLG